MLTLQGVSFCKLIHTVLAASQHTQELRHWQAAGADACGQLDLRQSFATAREAYILAHTHRQLQSLLVQLLP